MHPLRSLLLRARRAFTLIELIAVITVIAVLAGIAVVAYQALIARSEIEMAHAQEESVRRETVAILAFRDGTLPGDARLEALVDHGLAAAGVWAAAPLDEVDGATSSTRPGEVSVDAARSYVAWAVKVAPGSGVKCRVEATGAGESCWRSRGAFTGASAAEGSAGEAHVTPDLAPIGSPPVAPTTTTVPSNTTTTAPAATTSTTTTTTSTTTTTTTLPPVQPPGAPTSVAVSAPLLEASVSFEAPSDDGGSRITSYTATCVSPDGGTTRHNSGVVSPLTVRQLTADRTYTCTVYATNSAGAGPSSEPSAPFDTTVLPLVTTTFVGGSDAATPSPRWNTGLLDRAPAFGFDPDTQITSTGAASGTYLLAQAWDNRQATEFRTNQANPTIRVDFGADRAVVVTAAKAWIGANSGSGKLTVWGSADGTSWTQLGPERNYFTSAAIAEFGGVNNPSKFRYVEFRGASAGAKVGEIEIYGSLYPA